MSDSEPEFGVFTTGGTVQAGSGVYVPRKADEELYQLCISGTFAYILTARQMGKSSLMVRTADRLATNGVRSAIVDLTQIGAGNDVTAEQWYLGQLDVIADKLGLAFDVLSWWAERTHLTMTQRLIEFYEKIVLNEIPDRVVVFVDEIDTTLRLDFTDDFYAAIRYLYNARADLPKLKRLSFVLIGVAIPSDLIHNPEQTPFNIGQRVELTDFTLAESSVLLAGFNLPQKMAEQVLGWSMEWTGGHPYLTQRLCKAISEEGRNEWSKEDIEDVVTQTFLGQQSEQDNNLQFVRDMLTKRSQSAEGLTQGEVMVTYRDVQHRRIIVEDDKLSATKSHLKLSGVVASKGGMLVVRNAIYNAVFDKKWVREHMPPLWFKERLKRAEQTIAFLATCLAIVSTAFAITFFIGKEEAEELAAEAKNSKEAMEEEHTQEIEKSTKEINRLQRDSTFLVRSLDHTQDTLAHLSNAVFHTWKGLDWFSKGEHTEAHRSYSVAKNIYGSHIMPVRVKNPGKEIVRNLNLYGSDFQILSNLSIELPDEYDRARSYVDSILPFDTNVVKLDEVSTPIKFVAAASYESLAGIALIEGKDTSAYNEFLITKTLYSAIPLEKKSRQISRILDSLYFALSTPERRIAIRDSIKQELERDGDNHAAAAVSIDNVIELFAIYRESPDSVRLFNKALAYVDTVAALYLKSKGRTDSARSPYQSAEIYRAYGDSILAFPSVFKNDKIKDVSKVNAALMLYMKSASLYDSLGSVHDAATILQTSADFCSRAGWHQRAVEIYGSIAEVYRDDTLYSSQLDEARWYVKQGDIYADSTKENVQNLPVNLDSSLAFYQKAVAVCRNASPRLGLDLTRPMSLKPGRMAERYDSIRLYMAFIYETMADIYRLKGMIDTAIVNLKYAYDEYRSYQNRFYGREYDKMNEIYDVVADIMKLRRKDQISKSSKKIAQDIQNDVWISLNYLIEGPD